MSPFAFEVTTLAGELGNRATSSPGRFGPAPKAREKRPGDEVGGGGVMNPNSTQTLWLHVGTEFYVTITWEDLLKSPEFFWPSFLRTRLLHIAHIYFDLRKREKLGILSVVTVSIL